jgi:hypothetical protein
VCSAYVKIAIQRRVIKKQNNLSKTQEIESKQQFNDGFFFGLF